MMTYIKVFLDFRDAMTALGYAERGRLFTGMLDYASTGEEPQFSGNERIIWPMVRAQIDRDKAAFDDLSEARRSARSGKNKNNNCEQMISNDINSAQDKDKEKDKDKDYTPPLPPSRGDGTNASAISAQIDDAPLSDTVKAKLRQWLEYKGKSAYKLTGAKALVTRVSKAVSDYGDDAVCNLIDESMANGYRGIIFDRLGRGQTKPAQTVDSSGTGIAGGSFDTDDFFALAVQRGKQE